MSRLTSDRGHAAVAAGPYRYIRHPGYAATIVFELDLSTLLASRWAILLAGGCAILMVLRTGLEDRILHARLEGFRDYARRVRYRLLLGTW